MAAPTLVFRYLLLVLPAILLVTSGARVYGFFHERRDIWWTPRGTMVPLAESHARSRELDGLVAAGHLWCLEA